MEDANSETKLIPPELEQHLDEGKTIGDRPHDVDERQLQDTDIDQNPDPEAECRPVRNIEEDAAKLTEEKWPEVNGVYDTDGEWHDWSEITYSYSYDKELIILPYTICFIKLLGEQYVTESSTN